MKAEEGFQDQEEEHCDEEGPPYRARKAAVAGGILFFKKAESGIGKGGIKVDAGKSFERVLGSRTVDRNDALPKAIDSGLKIGIAGIVVIKIGIDTVAYFITHWQGGLFSGSCK